MLYLEILNKNEKHNYILYCLCSIFIYSSCNHQKKKLEEERTLDSIVIEEKHNREIEDSIKL